MPDQGPQSIVAHETVAHASSLDWELRRRDKKEGKSHLRLQITLRTLGFPTVSSFVL